MSLRQISTIQNMPVLDIETGTVLGRVCNWVVKPESRCLAAFVLNKTHLFKTPLVVVPTDIAEYAPDMIVVRNINSVITPREVVGLSELLTQKYTLTGFRAETENKSQIGVVNDFVFETISSDIIKLYVRPAGAAGLIGGDRIIPVGEIVGIRPRKVIFSDNINKPRIKSNEETTPVYRT